MSFNDLGKKDVPPHVDTPAQAEARARAAADLKAKSDARAARAAARREGTSPDKLAPFPDAAPAQGGPAKT